MVCLRYSFRSGSLRIKTKVLKKVKLCMIKKNILYKQTINTQFNQWRQNFMLIWKDNKII